MRGETGDAFRRAKEFFSRSAGENQKSLQQKVNTLCGKNEDYNPFLDNNGNLFNKYINYQKILDNPDVSSKAKEYIQKATGLSPTVAASFVQPSNAANAAEATRGARPGRITAAAVGSGQALQSGNSIVDAAKNYIGTPYVWGGESMSEGGMDCSGFVYNALKDAGYSVGRDTAQGYRSGGVHINKTDMQPGDLLFFGKNDNASHIGIYLGNGKMVHSSGGSKNTKSNPGKGVSITNIDYRGDFLEARRY